MERKQLDDTGKRIRARRIDLGMRQADLAKAVGISPSYLNLIEHGRRRIAGKLLVDIAQGLGVDPARIATGASDEVLDQLSLAAARVKAGLDTENAADMAARYPGWAALIGAQGRRITILEAQVQAMRDRLAHDPALAASLHEVISSVTSIRSTASILTGDDKLDADWLRRFHGNIHADAIKLAEHSDALIRYLESPGDSDMAVAPLDEANAWLSAHGFHLVGLENGETVSAYVAGAGLDAAASELLRAFATQYAADVAALPQDAFIPAAARARYDPAQLAQEFDVGFDLVLRRLASLPPKAGHPPIGIAFCDAAGGISFVKDVAGFKMERGGSACPLWPLFTALGQPGRPIRAVIEMPGAPPSQMQCFAQAVQTAAGYDVPPVVKAVMLVLPDPVEVVGQAQPIGPGCRLCPRPNCAARREPASIGLFT